MTIESLNLAKTNSVIIDALPAHCSNKLQPLDVSVYAPFKAHYNSAVDSWLLHHPGKPMTIYEVAQCVGLTHEWALTPSNIKAGFKATGIFPFDDKVFTDNDFLFSYVTDRENQTAPSMMPQSSWNVPSNYGKAKLAKNSNEPIEASSVDSHCLRVTPSTSKPDQNINSSVNKEKSDNFISP